MNEEAETEDRQQETSWRVGGNGFHDTRHRAWLAGKQAWGEMRSYDFVVGCPGHFVAVQVKSTIEELVGRYLCTVRGGKNRIYRRGDFDFLAAYVIFEDAWYIIPMEEILGKQHVSLYPNSEKGDYEGYREAWNLLGADPDSTGGGIVIQACVEEFSLSSDEFDWESAALR